MSMSMSMPMSGMAATTASSVSRSMTMAMSSATSAATSAASMGMDMGGHSMGEASGCRISMLWNWYTIDACFLSPNWRIRSAGMFAGSMIGIICLVIFLEALRRMSKEYDHHVIESFRKKTMLSMSEKGRSTSNDSSQTATGMSTSSNGSDKTLFNKSSGPMTFRPSLVQQMIRALLHMLQFATAYMIMLLAMYYNGYLIISIFIGAYLGFFLFAWESVVVDITPPEEATLCCG